MGETNRSGQPCRLGQGTDGETAKADTGGQVDRVSQDVLSGCFGGPAPRTSRNERSCCHPGQRRRESQ